MGWWAGKNNKTNRSVLPNSEEATNVFEVWQPVHRKLLEKLLITLLDWIFSWIILWWPFSKSCCAKTLWDFPPLQLQPVMVVPGQPQQLHLPLGTGATPGVLNWPNAVELAKCGEQVEKSHPKQRTKSPGWFNLRFKISWIRMISLWKNKGKQITVSYHLFNHLWIIFTLPTQTMITMHCWRANQYMIFPLEWQYNMVTLELRSLPHKFKFQSSAVWSSSFFPKCIFLGEFIATFAATLKFAESFANLKLPTMKSGQRRSYTSFFIHCMGGRVVFHVITLSSNKSYCIKLYKSKPLNKKHIFGDDVMVISHLLISVSCWQSTRLAAGGLDAGWAGPLAIVFLVHSSSNLNKNGCKHHVGSASLHSTWDKTKYQSNSWMRKIISPRNHPWIFAVEYPRKPVVQLIGDPRSLHLKSTPG